MKRRFRYISVIMLIMLFIAACAKEKEAPTAEPPAQEKIDLSTGFEAGNVDEYQKISENDRFLLSANLKNGDISILDKASAKTWYSNPVDRKEDTIANGFNKVALFSQVLLTYETTETVTMNVGSFMGCVSKSGLTYRIDNGSIIFKYNFVKEELEVPVRYSITEDEFVAEILTAGVQELGTNKVSTIDLLPFFGAGSAQDSGYILVPDGSGALIRFNNGKATTKGYEKNLYGFDSGVNDMLLNTNTGVNTSFTISENSYLPIFGEKCDDDGFIAIMTDGAARAQVKARAAGNYTSYNNVWSSYNYRTIGTVRLVQKEMNRASASIPEKQPDTSVNYKVLYKFLETGKADYSDMAKIYREHLIETAGLITRTKEGDIPFYLDLYGHIRKTKAFIGIPKDTLIVTTSIADSKAIVEQLNQGGVDNVVLKYNYWMKNGYYQTIQTSAELEHKLGSLKELQALSKQLEEKGGSLYLAAELMNVYKTGKEVSKLNDVLDSVANTPQAQYKFRLDVALPDNRYDPWFLIKPSYLYKYYDKFLNNLSKTGLSNIAFESIGSMAYSELASDGTSRTRIPAMNGLILENALKSIDNIMLTSANDYAAVHATHILNTPEKSSNYDIEDESIPFFQLVFHGYVNYSISASNLSSNPEDMALKCLEFGASPMYSWVARNSDELIGSKTDHLYSADYSRWITFAAEEYGKINDVLKDTATLEITSHRILQEDVTETVYGNTLRVIVNYNSTDVTIDGNLISAKDYLVLSEIE